MLREAQERLTCRFPRFTGLDIKPGKTPATRVNDYLWVHSYGLGSTLSLRLERVLGVELSEGTFDPAEVMADWKKEEPEWNVPREW